MTPSDNRSRIDSHDLSFLAGSAVVFHCHHFNVSFDQTIDDAVGAERGTELRTRASHEAWYLLLSSLCERMAVDGPGPRLEVAANLFAAAGHGRMSFDASAAGGTATGETLHYAVGWRDKYGSRLRRQYPIDGFAAGFAAAAVEVAHGLDAGSLACVESSCLVTGADRCAFTLSPASAVFVVEGRTDEAWRAVLPAPVTGLHDDRVEAITKGLVDFLGNVAGDDRGLVQAFGVLVTNHPADYYNHLSNRMLEVTQKEKPQTLEVARSLLQESGQICGFHTFGGILASPEWEALVGAPSDPLDVIIGGLAISRALGFGHWCLEAYEPDQRLVLVSSGTYESVHNKVVIEETRWPCSYLFQGGAVAMMQLAHRVEWQPRPTFSGALYLKLRRDAPWVCKQTHCVGRGDVHDRVVVTRA